jgi:hypothetical protein
MKKYLIGYGLNGGFGGIREYLIVEEEDMLSAMVTARQFAIAEYECYEGMNGVMDYGDCVREVAENMCIEQDELEIDDFYAVDCMYGEEVDSWIEYVAYDIKAGEVPEDVKKYVISEGMVENGVL